MAKKVEISKLIANLAYFSNNRQQALPSEIQPFLDSYEEFSIEWCYAKFRLMGYASWVVKDLYGNVNKKHDEFIQSQAPLAFIMACRIIRALLPFSSTLCQKAFPSIVYDRVSDEQNRCFVIALDYLPEKLSWYWNFSQISGKINRKAAAKTFFTTALPKALNDCIELKNLAVYRDIPDQIIDDLILPKSTKSMKKPSRARQAVTLSTAQNDAVEDFEASIAETVQITEPEDGPTNSEATEEQKTVSVAAVEAELEQVKVPEETFTSSVALSEGPHDIIQDYPNEVKDQGNRKSVVNFNELLKPRVIDVEYDPEEGAKWTRDYNEELAKYASMKDLSKMDSDEVASSQKKFRIVSSSAVDLDAGNTFVANWNTNDFLSLFPEAERVYYENIANTTALQALNDKGMRFRWVFDPSIVIDSSTYIFLCKVFGLITKGKDLTFLNFQKAFLNLTHGSPREVGSKNRTVFRFNHAFMLDGQICLPPIRGVHPEHLSSRFNHIQVRGFLERGGAHPYFFEVVR